MKIAILGTRGIPNTYGGFEQCAEKISYYFVKKGIDVTVYNPSDHCYKQSELNGVKIKTIFSNEELFSFFNVFIFDYLCLKDAIDKYDIILELGYHPSAIFYYLKKKHKAKIITNMAGMEWKRSKWNFITRKFIKYCEKLAVEKSDVIITDNLEIKKYFLKKYGKDSFHIAYGAQLFNNPQIQNIEKYGLKKYNYYMMMARFQRDNNYEMILDGYIASRANVPFIVIGDHTNRYGAFLKDKYQNYSNIKFVGGIYNYYVLSTLRWFSKLYFHGHSCGGTNPSLLEAMATNTYIATHDNPFNRNVIENNCLYFSNSDDVSFIIKNFTDEKRKDFIRFNRDKITNIYNWEKISEEYLKIFRKVAGN